MKNSTPKLIIVNQCATATTGSRDIRVCPRNSRNNVTVRAPLSPVRVGSGWPSRKTDRKCRTTRANSAIPTRVTTPQTTSATIWSADMAVTLLAGKRPLTPL